MRFTLKPISLILALAMLWGEVAVGQATEAGAPEEAAPDTAAVQTAPAAAADSSVLRSPPALTADTVKAGEHGAKPDSSRAKPSPVFGTWKPGQIKLDRNGRIFLAISAALLGGVYLTYLYFTK